jgi:hypothetical protein
MIAYLDLVAAIIDGERLVQREIDGGGILSVERDFRPRSHVQRVS